MLLYLPSQPVSPSQSFQRRSSGSPGVPPPTPVELPSPSTSLSGTLHTTLTPPGLAARMITLLEPPTSFLKWSQELLSKLLTPTAWTLPLSTGFAFLPTTLLAMAAPSPLLPRLRPLLPLPFTSQLLSLSPRPTPLPRRFLTASTLPGRSRQWMLTVSVPSPQTALTTSVTPMWPRTTMSTTTPTLTFPLHRTTLFACSLAMINPRIAALTPLRASLLLARRFSLSPSPLTLEMPSMPEPSRWFTSESSPPPSRSPRLSIPQVSPFPTTPTLRQETGTVSTPEITSVFLETSTSWTQLLPPLTRRTSQP
mmetsp:Transcript_14298/g.26322  ORF Transcript_14298/g.26322 Transcript_14298/m.26322 type:complete len:309 (-) Transcript_14298:443-1369(-)